VSYADQIRIEANAKTMRGLIADGIEETKAIADDANEKSTDAQNRVDNIIKLSQFCCNISRFFHPSFYQ
jgi:hypothetical protein